MGYRRAIIGLLLWSLLTASLAHAVDIQFRLSDGHVSGEPSDVSIESVEGYGIVTLIGSAADVIFPVPIGEPAASSCGTGRWEWTRITDAGGVTLAGAGMALIDGQVFFHTTSPLLQGCHRVSSKRETRAVIDQAILIGVTNLDPIILALSGVHTWKEELCPPTNNNANCVTWRAQADLVNARYPSRVQGATFETDMATLVTDGEALMNQQCAAQPGGPFC